MCMVLAIANIRDNSFENKVRIEQALKIALAGMAEVNKDGTGMAFSAVDGRVFMTKSAKEGHVVAEEFMIDLDIDYKHFIAHTRMATHGATNDMNAHPHETKFGYIVHNGWCPSLYQAHKKEMKTGCDSEALAHVYDNDPAVFDKNLLGSEHFALIHLDSNGKNVTIMNKNKMLYKCHSKTLSADIFLTSSSVIKDIGKSIGEELDFKMVHDGEVYVLDGEKIHDSKFKFTDTGYSSWGEYSWGAYSNDKDWFSKRYDSTPESEKRKESGKPIYYNRSKRKETNIPDHVFSMTRKERRRWIRDNKDKRDDYIQFWMDHERELNQQETQEEELRKDGFIILDCDGNILNEG